MTRFQILKNYFGLKPNQSTKELLEEFRELSDEELNELSDAAEKELNENSTRH